jgi:hypothetical protein
LGVYFSSMAMEERLDDEWTVTGEVPSGDSEWLVEPAREQFETRANNLSRSLRDDHEVATVINDESVSVSHKKEIIVGATLAGLTVASVLLATHHLRVRRKK